MSIEAMKNAFELAKKLDRDLSVETWELAKVMGQLEQAIAEAEKQEPVAKVVPKYSDMIDGHLEDGKDNDIYWLTESTCNEKLIPAGTLLYTHSQPRKWVDLNGEELETLLSENSSLTLGAIWAVSDKLKKKNNG